MKLNFCNKKYWCLSIAFLLGSACSAPEDVTSISGSTSVSTDTSAGAREGISLLMPNPVDLHDGLNATPLLFANGEITIDKEKASPENALAYESQLTIANRALTFVKEGDLSKTKKVAVLKGSGVDIVIFDLNLPPTVLGGDFAYMVVMDEKTGSLKGVAVTD